MAMGSAMLSIAILGLTADAIPTVAFPINSQVPPIARVTEPFSYTFSPSTFDSTLPMEYQLSDGPGWLSLESGTRHLSGTPSTSDVGEEDVTGLSIEVTATDSSGSTSINSTIVISRAPPPSIQIPLTEQLPTFGSYSAPSSLLFHPSTPFKFAFESGTFADTTSNLSYYAVTSDNTPLPSWITFDSTSLSFQGRTPDYASLIQPPQTFGIQLIASDITGFAGESIPFNVEVGVHLLAFENSTFTINASVGVPVVFSGLNLELDGVEVNTSSLSSIIANTSPWLAFDNSTYTLSGTPPPNSTSTNTTITAVDIYGDSATASVEIIIGTSIFESQIGNQNATIGKTFSSDLSTWLRSKSDIEITAQFNPATSWLSLDPQTFVLSGQVPSSLTPTSINITLSAISKTTQESATQSFEVFLISTTDVSSTKSTPTSATTGASSTKTRGHTASKSNHRLSKGVIAAIVVPIVVIALTILICMLWFRRQRYQGKKRTRPPSKSQISAPIEGSFRTDTKLNERIIPKDALHLDTSDFGDQSGTDMFGNEKKRHTQKSDLRRSQTTSDINVALTSQFTSSEGTSNRTRALSDNALSQTDWSWRSTQDSAYPTIGSSNRNSSQRLSRNYSRKGQARRSGQLLPGETLRESADYSMPPREGSQLGLRASDLSIMPVETLSVIPRHDKPLQTSDYSNPNKQPPVNRKSSKRKPFSAGIDRRRSGIGHGGRESISPVLGLLGKRRSIGHGQDGTSSSSGSGLPSESGLPRNSKTWVTMNEHEGSSNDRSTVSDLSAITDMISGREPGQSSNNAVLSSFMPPLSSGASMTSAASRPVSRRIGSSPFFGGSTRNSQQRTRNARTSYADSPTVPEEMISGTQNVIIHSHDEEDQRPRDSLGITYGSPREGTRQLRSFIQSQLTRSKTKSSMKSVKSMESRDSRFDSASVSTYSQSTHGISGLAIRRNEEGDENADVVVDNVSEGSWETQGSFRDTAGNLTEHGLHIPGLNVPGTRSSYAGTGSGIGISRSNPTSPMPDIGPNARMVPGRGRRPISVDAQTGQGSVRARVEQDEADWRAYV